MRRRTRGEPPSFPASASSSSSAAPEAGEMAGGGGGVVAGEMGENRVEQRSLTGQKAEPLGMKFTLFLSGHEKRGKPFDRPDLET